MIPYPKLAIREGDNRADLVKLVQARINELCVAKLAVDGSFRGLTRSAIRLFQTRQGFEPDGIIGPVTWAALFNQAPSPPPLPPTRLPAAALALARGQVGVRETGGPNLGKEIGLYLVSVGLPPGNSYCAAFGYWCFAEAAVNMGVKNPLVKTGKVLSHWRLAPMAVKIPIETARDDLSIIRPGSFFLIDHGNDQGHTGFVVEVRSSGLLTIEGNTDASGSREGQGVYERTRRFGEINLGYLDYSRLGAGP